MRRLHEQRTCRACHQPGGLDLFLEENMTYADRLSRAGVPVELHIYPRAYHGFYRATNARVTKQAEHDNREAQRRFLHG